MEHKVIKHINNDNTNINKQNQQVSNNNDNSKGQIIM